MKDKEKIIKTGYLLSYDYKFIFNSLKQTYDSTDEIFICYDKDGKTWAGNDFEIPETIFSDIRKLDHQKKITFYADTFYIPGKSTMDLETRQRNMLAEKMGKGGWHIQIDSDEYPINFKKLEVFLRKQKYLLKNTKKTPVNFFVNFVTLFKQTEDGFFVISPYTESCFLITNVPHYSHARYPHNSYSLKLDFNNIHQSWAREGHEILQKINNWGHNNDFDTSEFYKTWESLSSENYTQFKDFHPIYPKDWKELQFIPAKNIEEFIINFEKNYPQQDIQIPLPFKKRLKLYLKSLF
ncbi:hypothetical protein D1631_17860 [Chryseobacterium nematophagum]|uniref:Uncharacterized protein n=1 Tax=Chryseobacterium nematophagum TaxID=2305228 RepID=A0A3M7TKU3_9FLAO|nr:hypothetical protein [Chryseobacterium nematophagum]RNA63646.1 hypothetical protein D1631_17860 [Chryseobacterium nematophagum]